MTRLKYIYYTISIIGIIIFISFYLRIRLKDGRCIIHDIMLSNYCNDIVVNKEKNIKSRGDAEAIFFKKSRLFTWHEDNFKIYDKIQVGDSVVKEKGSLELWVYRQDTSFMIDLSFPCEE